MVKSVKTRHGIKIQDISYKRIDGVVVKPVLYVGHQIGHGRYIAGSLKGKLVVGKDGVPLPYRDIISDKNKSNQIVL